MSLDTKVEYIDDVKKIIDLGLMQSPVLIINNKPILTGYTSDKEKIKSSGIYDGRSWLIHSRSLNS